MPIEHHADGATTFTGEAVTYYRMCVLKSAVGLELKGIRIRRGPVVWKQVKQEFNLIGASKHHVYTWLCAKVDELAAQQQHIPANPPAPEDV